MITITKLNKSFGDHIVFKDFSLEIKSGEFIVFTGPSGCGKTTLLNMIGGIESADSGEIKVNDYVVTNKRNLRQYYQKYVGFLFQNFALVEAKTVEENLKIIHHKAKNEMTIQDALERVGMSGKEKQKVYSLSGGEQQRIALARLMLKKCDVILADEPTGSLDRGNAVQVMNILKSFREDGKTVIMVTHDPSLIDGSMKKIELRPYSE